MTIPAAHCEAKLHAFRKTQEGVVVSFVLHPAEVPERLALDSLGTRYMLALVAIGDDETPLPSSPLTGRVDEGSGRGTPTSSPNNNARNRYQFQTDMEKARDRAGMLSHDLRFWKWVGVSNEDEAARALRAEIAVNSRSEIATDIDAYDAYIKLETKYKAATGQIAEQRR